MPRAGGYFLGPLGSGNRHLTVMSGPGLPEQSSSSSSVFGAGIRCEALSAIATTLRLGVPLCSWARCQEIQTVTQL